MSDQEQDNILPSLTAMLDGELADEDLLRVLGALERNPDMLHLLRDQQRLTLAATRVLSTPPVRAPDQLRKRIESMAVAPPKAVAGKIHWAQVAIRGIAAALLVGVGVWYGQSSAPRATFPTPIASEAPVIPASIVSRASRIHDDCSRLALGLHSASFPTDTGELAAEVKADLHTEEPYPDLSPAGFKLEGAGPCSAPVGTVHLLYRTMRPGSHATVSLFVQRYTGQFTFPVDRVLTVSVAASPFPMLAWRTDHVVYFLIADDQHILDDVMNVLRSKNGVTTQP